jgi:Rrf2 family protein
MLSATSTYAVRAATCIAQNEKPVSAKEIALAASVPFKYLQQILKSLVNTGILSSSRGVGGGFCLNQPAHEIVLSQIVRTFDNVEKQISCPFGDERECLVKPTCAIHEHWMGFVKPYVELLERTTLADLADNCPKGLPEGLESEGGNFKKRMSEVFNIFLNKKG